MLEDREELGEVPGGHGLAVVRGGGECGSGGDRGEKDRVGGLWAAERSMEGGDVLVELAGA